jgi:hypothetical protein
MTHPEARAAHDTCRLVSETRAPWGFGGFRQATRPRRGSVPRGGFGGRSGGLGRDPTGTTPPVGGRVRAGTRWVRMSDREAAGGRDRPRTNAVFGSRPVPPVGTDSPRRGYPPGKKRSETDFPADTDFPAKHPQHAEFMVRGPLRPRGVRHRQGEPAAGPAGLTMNLAARLTRSDADPASRRRWCRRRSRSPLATPPRAWLGCR